MAHVPAFTFLFITLLVLCSSEISNAQSESWYSANVINDDVYSPKPLIEIFSTEATFSSTNPIVVLSSSSTSSLNNEAISTSTPNPQQSISSNTSPSTTTTEVSVIPLPSSTPPSQQIDSQPPQSSIAPQLSVSSQPPSTPIQLQTLQPQPTPPPLIQSQSQPIQQQSQTIQPQQTTIQLLPTSQSQETTIQPQSTNQPQLIQSRLQPFQAQPQLMQIQTQTAQSPLQFQPVQNQPSTIQLLLPAQLPQLNSSPQSKLDQPNYFVIYQQAPQTIQNYPSGSSTVSLPAVTDSPTTPFPVIAQSTAIPLSTSTDNQPALSSSPIPTIIQSVPPITQLTTVSLNISNITSPIKSSCENNSNLASTTATNIQRPDNSAPMFRIRMISPRGTITNVILNPMSTTARTTTTRTRSKKQNYNDCINTCGGTRQPICASPIGLRPINANTLKGFPSVCHMACHNSFRKNLYEKVVDGRCGRLRTRIQTIDSNNKLNRKELQRLQYGVVQIGPDAMFEISQ